jgi:hypothetical protein
MWRCVADRVVFDYSKKRDVIAFKGHEVQTE